MRITVQSFADLRDVIESELFVDTGKHQTIRGLLSELCLRFPGLQEALFEKPGVLKEYVNILKNGRNIAFLEGLSTPVSEGDTITLFPPVAGG